MITACHKIITPNCQKVHGSPQFAAFKALAEIETAALDALKGYGAEANIHIKVEIERINNPHNET